MCYYDDSKTRNNIFIAATINDFSIISHFFNAIEFRFKLNDQIIIIHSLLFIFQITLSDYIETVVNILFLVYLTQFLNKQFSTYSISLTHSRICHTLRKRSHKS